MEQQWIHDQAQPFGPTEVLISHARLKTRQIVDTRQQIGSGNGSRIDYQSLLCSVCVDNSRRGKRRRRRREEEIGKAAENGKGAYTENGQRGWIDRSRAEINNFNPPVSLLSCFRGCSTTKQGGKLPWLIYLGRFSITYLSDRLGLWCVSPCSCQSVNNTLPMTWITSV